MAYAVTCTSCGARFSVGDELFQTKFAGRVVTIRCKQCQASIRLNATVPPGEGDATTTPRADQRAKTGPARARPTPPRPPRKTEDRDSPGPFVALSPGLLGSRSFGGGDGDVFDAPPPSSPELLDLSDMAQSVPPSDAEPPTHRRKDNAKNASEDVDFLLGLSGSPGTTALLGPPPTFDSEPAPATAKEPEIELTSSADGDSDSDSDSDSEARLAAAPEPAAVSPGRTSARRWGVALAGVLLVAAAAAIRFGLLPKPAERAVAPANAMEPATTTEEPVAPALEPSRPTQSSAEPSAEATPSSEATAPEAVKLPARRPAAQAKSAAAPESTEPVARAAPDPSMAPPEAPPAGPFSKAAAGTALGAAVNQASACRKPGDPSGTASVTVTFAPSGRVTSATISGPPFAGTPTGGCIAATLRRARVPAFEGEKVTVTKSVVID